MMSRGRTRSTVNAGPSAAFSTNHFARSLPLGISDETETANAQPPKGKGPGLTLFATSQLPDHLVLYILMACVDKLEEETDYALNSGPAELK